MFTHQTLTKKYASAFEVAKKYYGVVFFMNDLRVTPSELTLVAFSAVKGTFSTPPVREEFTELFNIPKQSIYNMLAKLQKQGVLVKGEDNKIRVNPKISLDFSKSVIMELKLINEE